MKNKLYTVYYYVITGYTVSAFSPKEAKIKAESCLYGEYGDCMREGKDFKLVRVVKEKEKK